MQPCFGLARLSKNCVNKTSIILSKRANSSVAETFTRNGFVDQVPVVHSDSLAPVRALLTKLESEHGGRLPGQLSSQHLLYPELASLALSPALLNTVSSLLGPDLVLLATTLFAKYPSSSELGERYVGAHQDLKFWGISPLVEATAWIAIDRASPVSGAMMFLPGSHMKGLLDHQKGDREKNILQDNQDIALTDEEKQRLVQSDLQPGQASIHSGLTVHFSPPNQSDKRRAGLQIVFVTPEARLGPMGYANAYKDDWRKPILVKGEDKFGHLKYWTSVEELLAGKAGAGVPSTAR